MTARRGRKPAESEQEPEEQPIDVALQVSATAEPPAAEPETQDLPKGRQPDFIWAGQPVYSCRFCGDQYQVVGGGPRDALAAVLDHEATQHPTNARLSHVLGPDGRPLIVVD